VTDGQLGRERPLASAPWGGVDGRESGVAHAPSPALTHRRADCGRQRTPPRSVSAIAARQCVTSSLPRPTAARIRNHGRFADCSTRRRRGNAHPESFIPPVLRNFYERPSAQAQRDARRHEVGPGTRRSHAGGPECRERQVMLPGRRHGFRPRSIADGLRRIEDHERPFELPARGLDPRPKRPTPRARTVARTRSAPRFATVSKAS